MREASLQMHFLLVFFFLPQKTNQLHSSGWDVCSVPPTPVRVTRTRNAPVIKPPSPVSGQVVQWLFYTHWSACLRLWRRP